MWENFRFFESVTHTRSDYCVKWLTFVSAESGPTERVNKHTSSTFHIRC